MALARSLELSTPVRGQHCFEKRGDRLELDRRPRNTYYTTISQFGQIGLHTLLFLSGANLLLNCFSMLQYFNGVSTNST